MDEHGVHDQDFTGFLQSRYSDDKTFRDVSRELDVPYSTLWSTAKRVKLQLRSQSEITALEWQRPEYRASVKKGWFQSRRNIGSGYQKDVITEQLSTNEQLVFNLLKREGTNERDVAKMLKLPIDEVTKITQKINDLQNAKSQEGIDESA
jgi:DNA-directed RNA polymerase specialized sigma subunit